MGLARHGIPFSESRAVTVCNSSGLTWVDGEQGRFDNVEDAEVEDTLTTIFSYPFIFYVLYLCKESYVETGLCLMTLSNHHLPTWKRYHLFYTYDFFRMKFLVLPSLKGIL